MVKVAENTTNQQWGKNELHFHFKCAKQGLEESKRAMDQLLSIVRSENDIGLVKNGQLSYLQKRVNENWDYTVESGEGRAEG